jgi:flagellar basal body P-ring protein FlgI
METAMMGRSFLIHPGPLFASLVAVSAISAGCATESENKAKVGLGVAAIVSSGTSSASYRDTIGASAYFEGLGPMRVRGYGLVVGLGKNGSSDCPRPIYDRLLQSLYKQHRFSSGVVGEKGVSPEHVIADLDTAVVLVQGDIPPAALEGTRFDLFISAIPGTQTKSLRGGRLFTAELEVFRDMGKDISITGQVLAQGAGPVFINPLSDAESATQSSDLEGVVLGGGVATKDRRVRLVLTEPSYPRARQIQDRINAQFSAGAKVADALSPSFVQIHVPPEFRDDAGHFLALVRGMCLNRDPAFAANRARELGAELLSPAAPHAQIAWSFESLGRNALPVLGDLYRNSRAFVRFHAAAAGMRLGDHVAGDAMAAVAMEPDGEFRFQAIRALGEARGMSAAATPLRTLLGDADPRVQVAAYEALIARHDPTIRSVPVGPGNFRLDSIPSAGAGFIYAKRTKEQRIALFGADLHCTPPLLYRSSDGAMTLNAAEGDSALIILRTVVASGATSQPIPAPLKLSGLIPLLGHDAAVDADNNAIGLGFDYGSLVRALYQLCRSGAIDAKFILEEPNAAELFGPAQPQGRPESEL